MTINEKTIPKKMWWINIVGILTAGYIVMGDMELLVEQ